MRGNVNILRRVLLLTFQLDFVWSTLIPLAQQADIFNNISAELLFQHFTTITQKLIRQKNSRRGEKRVPTSPKVQHLERDESKATSPTDGGDVRGVELTLGEPPQHARLPDARVAQQEQPEQHIVLFGHDNNRRARPLLPTSTWCLPLALHLKPPRIFRFLQGLPQRSKAGHTVSPVIMARRLKSSQMALTLSWVILPFLIFDVALESLLLGFPSNSESIRTCILEEWECQTGPSPLRSTCVERSKHKNAGRASLNGNTLTPTFKRIRKAHADLHMYHNDCVRATYLSMI